MKTQRFVFQISVMAINLHQLINATTANYWINQSKKTSDKLKRTIDWGLCDYLEDKSIQEEANRGKEKSKDRKDAEIGITRVWFLVPVNGGKRINEIQAHLLFNPKLKQQIESNFRERKRSPKMEAKGR